MSEQVQVSISKRVFDRLKALAEPLVDNTDSVIERLLDHWDHGSHSAPEIVKSISTVPLEYWVSARGDSLPVGMKLRGSYLNHTYKAEVERAGIRFNGDVFDSLSAAAIAAKQLAGTRGKAANSNGREFWRFQDPTSGRWTPVSALRPGPRIDTRGLLEEIENLP